MSNESFSNVSTAQNVVILGMKKANSPLSKVFLLGIMGGIFVSLGFYGTLSIMSTVRGGELETLATLLGAMVFPVGLMLVLLIGGDLFTGNSLITLSVLDKKATLRQLANNWIVVWIGNFVGCIVAAFFIANSGEVSLKIQLTTFAIVDKKLALNNMEVIISAFFCNVLVALAVWASLSTDQVIGKIFTVFFPIFLFVIAGFQHCVANMFLFSFATFLSYQEGIAHMFNDIVMATIGNAISGGIIVPLVYYILYVKDNK